MEALISNSLELDYEIFYTLTLKKEFTQEYSNIFNYNLDSIDKLKEAFDFENFSFENFYQLLKLFDECDTQRKNFRTLSLKFMRDRHSLDNFMKEDENLILNKFKIHTEMKDKIIEHQYNKLIEFSNEIAVLRKELEKITKEFNAVKSNLTCNNLSSKAANANLINKRSLVNSNKNNLNNPSNLIGTKSKILKKIKTPIKIANVVNKANNLLSNTNNTNIKDTPSQSNANNSTASKNSTGNNKSGEILNATFCALKTGLDNDNVNNNNISMASNNNNTNLITKKNTFNNNNSNNKNESNNASNLNKQDLLISSKKSKFKSNSKIIHKNRIHRKNNSLCEKSLESHFRVGSPSSNLNISADCTDSAQSKQIHKLNSLKQNIPSKSGSMNITMKVNNINNFNNSIHANIISNSAESINKDFLEAHSTSLINYSNLNTNSNLLNDSFNNNSNYNNTNENLLKKIMNLDFLGEQCNIISNSPINSPKIKLSSREQTESSVHNFSGGSPHVNFNDINVNRNKVKINKIQDSDDINNPKGLSSNSCYSQSEQLNRNNTINRNQKGLNNLENIEIPNDQTIQNLSNSNNKMNNNNNNNHNDLSISKRKLRENSHDTSGCSENKNSPCFKTEGASGQNPLSNSNCFGYTHTFNGYPSNSNEDAYADVKRKINYEQSNEFKNKKKLEFEPNANTQDSFFEDEKPKDFEYTKSERYSSSIPRKRVLKVKNLLTNFNENCEENKTLDASSLIALNPRAAGTSQIKKPSLATNLKSKKNFLDPELTSTLKNLTLNDNVTNNYASKKSLTPRKNNLTQKNSFNYSSNLAGSFNNNSNMQKQKLHSVISPSKLKKGHSSSIDYDIKSLSAFDNKALNNSHQYQSNFANYNTSIKKRKQKQNSDLYESENLNTHASCAKPRLDISDITYQNTLNKSDLYDYTPDADRFQTHTSRGNANAKKLILVEKIPNNKAQSNVNLNSNLSYKENNKDSKLIENMYGLDGCEEKKINLIKINNKNTRNNALMNNCSISSSFNEEPCRDPNNEISGFSTVLNCNVKSENKKNSKLNNSSVNTCNPNFKESKVTMELLNKSSKTTSNDSFSTNTAGYGGFSRNGAASNYANFNLRLNATLNSINELKRKMNL